MYKDFLLFAGANVQISAVPFTFSVTDRKHVLLICFDIFSSFFLILNNVWKFKIYSGLGISKHASSSITSIVPIHLQINKKHWSIYKFSVFSRIYKMFACQTCELKSKITDYRRYYVKNCATTHFLPNFNKMLASWNSICFRKAYVLVIPNVFYLMYLSKIIEPLVCMYVLMYHVFFLKYIYL